MIPTKVLPARSFAPICCGVLGEANSSFMAVSRQYYLNAELVNSVPLSALRRPKRTPVGITRPLLNSSRESTVLRFLLDEKYLLLLCVLVNELCDAVVTTQRLRGYGAHGVNGDYLESTLYIIRRLLRMSLLLTLTDGADITCVCLPVVLDPIARLFPQNIHAFAIDVSHTRVPQVSRLSSHARPPEPPPISRLKEHSNLPLASSVPNTFIGRTMSSHFNLGLPG